MPIKFLRKSDKFLNEQLRNTPNIERQAVAVTGGLTSKEQELIIKLKPERLKRFKKHLEKEHPSTRGRIFIE